MNILRPVAITIAIGLGVTLANTIGTLDQRPDLVFLGGLVLTAVLAGIVGLIAWIRQRIGASGS